MTARRDSPFLVLAWGNPARQDDALGPSFAAAVRQWNEPRLVVESDFQLQPEMAATIADYATVVFVDAHRECDGAFVFERLQPGPPVLFSTHSMSPEGLLALAEDHFSARPEAYLLGIRGMQFDDFGEQLTAAAQRHLAAALSFFRPWLHSGERDLDDLPASKLSTKGLAGERRLNGTRVASPL